MAKFGKTYATKSDVNSKYEVFVQNFRQVKEHNEKSATYQMGINKFSDLTIEEFSNLYHKNGLAVPMNRSEKKMKLQTPMVDDGKEAPESADWRAAGRVSTP